VLDQWSYNPRANRDKLEAVGKFAPPCPSTMCWMGEKVRVRAQGIFSLQHLIVRPETVGTFQSGRREAERDGTAACSARHYTFYRVRSRSCPLPPQHHIIASIGEPGVSRDAGRVGAVFGWRRRSAFAGRMFAEPCKRWSSSCQSAFIRGRFPDRGGLGRRREALIGMLLNDFLGQRFNDWRYVLLWRLKPLHPPSIT